MLSSLSSSSAASDVYNFFFLMIRRPPRATQSRSSAASDVYKRQLILRDIDILSDIKEHSPVLCKITITAAEDGLASKLEPGVCPSSARFEAVKRLSEAGIFTGILLMPVLPFLEDNEENVISIVRKAHEAGAKFIYPAFGMTMRERQREWYYAKLKEIFPEEDYVSRYQKRYGIRYKCTSPRAAALWEVFTQECRKCGILYEMKHIVRVYKRGYECTQLSLFDNL